jgi:hypothetical protein
MNIIADHLCPHLNSNTENLFKGAYIGMKDKDGALLFEGDRVQFYDNDQNVICTIVYVPEWAMFCLKWDDGNCNKNPLNPEKYTKVI